MPDSDLIAAARDARQGAVAPYSRFLVGAALETDDGTIFTGCNVESASYGLTMCAERVAVFTAIAAGARRFTGIAIVTDTDAATPPCGACRQVLWDQCGDIDVVVANLTSELARFRLRDLLPHPFDAGNLNDARTDGR